ncbi:MAG TPA: hypothetical protein VMS77_03375 [Conexivisphaerales archaeon]|nr:hypothetical protein [Conexivisphaerales archaeon]
MDPKLLARLRRMYPSCTRRELDELASSIEGDKFWRARGDFVFAVALTRARSLHGGSWVARATGVRVMRVPEGLRPFCRKGRVALLASEKEPVVSLFLGWPAFLWAMRKEEVAAVIEGASTGRLRGYVGVPALKEYLGYRQEGLAGPSG